MKNAIKKNVVLVMLFAMLCSYATESPSLKNKEDGKTTLVLKDVRLGEELIIKDFYGVILYKESIQHNGDYSKSFDLTELPDGNYSFELEKALQIQIIPFKVSFNTVSFNKEEGNIIYKPFVRIKDNFVYVTQLSLKEKPLKIDLFYEYSNDDFNKIHSETIKNTKQIKRVYKLSKDRKGTYKVVFECEGRTFKNIIEI